MKKCIDCVGMRDVYNFAIFCRQLPEYGFIPNIDLKYCDSGLYFIFTLRKKDGYELIINETIEIDIHKDRSDYQENFKKFDRMLEKVTALVDEARKRDFSEHLTAWRKAGGINESGGSE